jgi:hypothetical protein
MFIYTVYGIYLDIIVNIGYLIKFQVPLLQHRLVIEVQVMIY